MAKDLEAITIEGVNPEEFVGMKNFMEQHNLGTFTHICHDSDPYMYFFRGEDTWEVSVSLKLGYDSKHKRVRFFAEEGSKPIPLERSKIYQDYFRSEVQALIERFQEYLANIKMAKDYKF